MFTNLSDHDTTNKAYRHSKELAHGPWPKYFRSVSFDKNAQNKDEGVLA
jgi:hypothetical protein